MLWLSQLDHGVSASDEMYRRVVMAVPEGIWVVDPEGCTIFSNQRMAEILGVAFESMPGAILLYVRLSGRFGRGTK
jgi:PAS domain S-box-containing protein